MAEHDWLRFFVYAGGTIAAATLLLLACFKRIDY